MQCRISKVFLHRNIFERFRPSLLTGMLTARGTVETRTKTEVSDQDIPLGTAVHSTHRQLISIL